MKELPLQNKIEAKPIGFVKRTTPNEDVKDKNLIARIVLKKELTKALDGIEGFSHIFVVFWMHQITDAEKIVLKVHPRGRAELPLVGVFATRAPNRPNPVGLTLVELVKREKNVLWVRSLDALNNTPVLDVKPYDRWDTALEAKVPGWWTELTK